MALDGANHREWAVWLTAHSPLLPIVVSRDGATVYHTVIRPDPDEPDNGLYALDLSPCLGRDGGRRGAPRSSAPSSFYYPVAQARLLPGTGLHDLWTYRWASRVPSVQKTRPTASWVWPPSHGRLELLYVLLGRDRTSLSCATSRAHRRSRCTPWSRRGIAFLAECRWPDVDGRRHDLAGERSGRRATPPSRPGVAAGVVTSGDEMLERLRPTAICLAFPDVRERLTHGAPTWFFRGRRAFVRLWADGHHDNRFPHLWCAAPPGAQQGLIEASSGLLRGTARMARHPARRPGRLDEIGALCREAYRVVTPVRYRRPRERP